MAAMLGWVFHGFPTKIFKWWFPAMDVDATGIRWDAIAFCCQEPGITLPQTEHVTYGPITAYAMALRRKKSSRNGMVCPCNLINSIMNLAIYIHLWWSWDILRIFEDGLFLALPQYFYCQVGMVRLQERKRCWSLDLLHLNSHATTPAGHAGPHTGPLAASSDIAGGDRQKQWLWERSLDGDLHYEFSNGAECRRGSSNQYHRSLSRSDQCRFARRRRLGFAAEGEWNQIQRWAYWDSVRHPAQ